MAKYIIDVDSLMSCLDFISEGKMVRGNSEYDWAYLQNVKAFIDRFPKDKVKDDIDFEEINIGKRKE